MPPEPKIGLIILAAGASNRMNGETPKQMLHFRGKTLLRGAAETALKAGFYETIAVLGSNAEKFKKEIEDLPVRIVFNENWSGGISSSIKAGLAALSETDAAIIMLCDQPLVTEKILINLRGAFAKTGKPIAACRYENTIGVPALFAREFFDELMSLKQDDGAKKLIKKHLDKATLIDAREAAFDVDTPQDYEKLKTFRSPDE